MMLRRIAKHCTLCTKHAKRVVQPSVILAWNPVRTFSCTSTVHSSKTQLTSDKFPHLERKSFASLTQVDLDHFRGILKGKTQVITDDLDGYNTDWLGSVRGNSKLILRPKSTAEVSGILQYCNSRKLAVVPQSGNTSLVGGSVPVFDEIVLSMQLMNKINQVDETSGVLTCEAGCILETLDTHLADRGLMMPLDLGAKGSCMIGGNVSTNAGGIRLIRYGSLHGSVIGIEAVLANGEVVDCLSTIRKDNTGYDIKQLFVGSEGTLGVVTAVSILCPTRPSSVNLVFLGCTTFSEVLETLKQSKQDLGEILSAFEFMDDDCMKSLKTNLKMSNPLQQGYPFYVVVETSGSNSQHDETKLNDFLENVMATGCVKDGTVATEPSKIKALWDMREMIAESLLGDGYCYKYDVSLPLSHYYKIVEETREKLASQPHEVTRVVGYGHVGDGNLHLNITAPKYNPEISQIFEPFLYNYVADVRGSISAEHGLGLFKKNYIHLSKSSAAVKMMKQMKALLDPQGILNPYKTLPD